MKTFTVDRAYLEEQAREAVRTYFLPFTLLGRGLRAVMRSARKPFSRGWTRS